MLNSLDFKLQTVVILNLIRCSVFTIADQNKKIVREVGESLTNSTTSVLRSKQGGTSVKHVHNWTSLWETEKISI